MEKIDRQQGVAIPLDRSNVDTDAIIPKQFLTSIKRTGFGQNLFDEWRYEDYGVPGADCSTRPGVAPRAPGRNASGTCIAARRPAGAPGWP